jgi:hypothetical protein
MNNNSPSPSPQIVTRIAPPSGALIAYWPSQGKLHQSSSLIKSFLLTWILLRKTVKI